MPEQNVPLIFRERVLIEPPSHDGQLEGLIWSSLGDVKPNRDLTIRWFHFGTTFYLTVPDILAMRFTDIMEGNIIFEFEAIDAAGLADEQLAFLFGYGGAPKPHELPHHRTKLANATALLVGSSYGCEGIAVTKCRPSEWACCRLT